MPFHRLLEIDFFWIWADKSTVIRPGVDLVGVQEYSNSPTLTVLLVFPKMGQVPTGWLQWKYRGVPLKLFMLIGFSLPKLLQGWTSSRSLERRALNMPLVVPLKVPLHVSLKVPLLARPPLPCARKRGPLTAPPTPRKSHIAFRGTSKGNSRAC